MKANEAKRLRELESGNARLKKLLAEAELDKAMPRSWPRELLTPERRRRAVVVLVDRFGVSQRRACRVSGQHRSTQRLTPRPRPEAEEKVRRRLRQIARKHPRWAWKTAHTILHREGHTINRKRTRRLWGTWGCAGRAPCKRKRRRAAGHCCGRAAEPRVGHRLPVRRDRGSQEVEAVQHRR